MKIVLGMSGGVDSAASAYLLQQAGHQVYGLTLHMTDAAPPDVEGARRTAVRLGIPHEVVDCRARFGAVIEASFAASYAAGETPNPCALCNRLVKLAALEEYRATKGLDAIATGHYARTATNTQGEPMLLRAADLLKDQSYMLYRITKEQLAHLVLPLGEMTKPQIRALAAEQSLLPVIPRDSMDICFIPDGDYGAYLCRCHGMQPTSGDFRDTQGCTLGKHQGQWLYTVGQRKGLGLACGVPIYVLSKDTETNTVIVGREEQLFANTCYLRDCNWLTDVALTFRATAKIRYSRTEAAVTVQRFADGGAVLMFDTPQRAMACGQSGVIYDGEHVLGGGIITTADAGKNNECII